MTTVTRVQFETMPAKLGGDLWNRYRLCKIAFNKFPKAVSIQYTIGTGLWVDVTYRTDMGEIKTGTVYDSEKY